MKNGRGVHGETWEDDGLAFDVSEGGPKILAARVGVIYINDAESRTPAVWIETAENCVALSPETWKALAGHVEKRLATHKSPTIG